MVSSPQIAVDTADRFNAAIDRCRVLALALEGARTLHTTTQNDPVFTPIILQLDSVVAEFDALGDVIFPEPPAPVKAAA